jgi:acetyltransferase-like isoleucine patch superfamily enzyme
LPRQVAQVMECEKLNAGTSMRWRLLSAYQRLRIIKFRLLSSCRNVIGRAVVRQPVQLVGEGRIQFNGEVCLGCYPSPYFLSGYIYIEARSTSSIVEIGDGVWINNNSALISNGPGIFIGRRSMLGTNCEIIDNDFHDTHPERRMNGKPRAAKVEIGENVLIGSNVKILKGVRIGSNSVIANGTVVNRSVPENMLAFGNPVKCGRLVDLSQWTRKEKT